MTAMRVSADVLYWIAVAWLLINLAGIPIVFYKLLFKPSALYGPTQARLAELGTPLAVVESLLLAATLGIPVYLVRDGGIDRMHIFWLVPAYLLSCKLINRGVRVLAGRR